MSLSRCTSCESIEGGFREPTDEELLAQGVEPTEYDGDIEAYVCKQCGDSGCYQGIPEHDDLDMER